MLEQSRNIGNLVGKFRYYFKLGVVLSKDCAQLELNCDRITCAVVHACGLLP